MDKVVWDTCGTIIWSRTDQAIVCEMSEPRPPGCGIVHEQVNISSPYWDEMVANMRLIKAAPNLLQLAKRAEVLIDKWCQYTGSVEWAEYAEGREVRGDLRECIAAVEDNQ